MSPSPLISSPRHVDIAITGRCNLSCAYCFYADEMNARRDLSTAQWLAFIKVLGDLGVMTVTLTGGEALSRSDFFQLVDGVIANRMRYSLLTNATLVTEKTLQAFELGKRRQRLDSIQTSIDGSCSGVHDRSRPNSFGRALRGLRLLQSAGLPLTVRVTVNRHNIHDLENIARLLLEDLNLPGFSTNEAYPCGATDRFEAGITLTPDQRLQAMQVLSELAQRYPGRVNAAAGPLALAREKTTIEARLTEGHTDLPGRGYLTGCGGVYSHVAVLHDGGIVPCHNLSSLVLGNIQEDDFGQVWREHPTLQALRDRSQIPITSLETCRDCTYNGFCTGGCPGGALFQNGDFNTRNPMDCYRILIGEEAYPPANNLPMSASIPAGQTGRGDRP